MVSFGNYKGEKTVVLSGKNCSYEFLVEHGANLISARTPKREFMYHRPSDKFISVPFGGTFDDAEFSGMDDMFPTIEQYYYESAPWEGTKLADHGEVWNLPAEVAIDGEKVTFTIYGIRLPYVFNKTVYLKEDGTLRIEYKAENRTCFPMTYMWAGHVIMRAERGLRMRVPEGVDKALSIFKLNSAIGDFCEEIDFPNYKGTDGQIHDISIMNEKDGCSEKIFLKKALSKGFFAVDFPDNSSFELNFPEDKVPYMGLLMDYSRLTEAPLLFIEPCTGLFDRADIARRKGTSSQIDANSAAEWWMEIKIK